MKTRSEIVSFRCPPELGREIDRAREPFQISRGDWVRSAVLAQLNQSDLQSLTDQIDDMRQAVASLNDDLQELTRKLAKTAYLILTNERLSADEAKRVIRRHLLSEEGTP